MARLIEFFTRTGDLVLDPFAGVGGTLLGAAISRGPRRALGLEIEPRWAAVFEDVVRDAAGAAGRAGPAPHGPRTERSGRPAHVRPGRPRAASRRCARAAPGARRRLGGLRRDRPAVQRPDAADHVRREAGRVVRQPADRLRDGHRRPCRPCEQPRLRDLPRSDGAGVRRVAARPAARPIRRGDRARRLPGRALPVHGRGPRRRARPAPGSW